MVLNIALAKILPPSHDLFALLKFSDWLAAALTRENLFFPRVTLHQLILTIYRPDTFLITADALY